MKLATDEVVWKFHGDSPMHGGRFANIAVKDLYGWHDNSACKFNDALLSQCVWKRSCTRAVAGAVFVTVVGTFSSKCLKMGGEVKAGRSFSMALVHPSEHGNRPLQIVA